MTTAEVLRAMFTDVTAFMVALSGVLIGLFGAVGAFGAWHSNRQTHRIVNSQRDAMIEKEEAMMQEIDRLRQELLAIHRDALTVEVRELRSIILARSLIPPPAESQSP
jgi:hypothetical protein